MLPAADTIRDQAAEPHFSIEDTDSIGNRRYRPHHTGGTDDKDHRSIEPFCNFGRRTLIAVRRGAVEQPHHPLDNRDITSTSGACESGADLLAAHHPPVKIMRSDPSGAAMPSRIKVVGAALENRHAQVASAHRGSERNRHSGLSCAAFQGPDYNTRDWMTHCSNHSCPA
jgi:hypothetical protein